MVLNPHADGVDKDGHHDASVKVLALYDAPQLLPRVLPKFFASFLWTTSYMVLGTFRVFFVLVFGSLFLFILIVGFVHGFLLCFIASDTDGSHSVSTFQCCSTLRTTVSLRGSGQGYRLS